MRTMSQVTKVINERRGLALERRHRSVGRKRTYLLADKTTDTKELTFELSVARKILAIRKRRNRIHTAIATVLAIAILYFFATYVEWYWLFRHFKS